MDKLTLQKNQLAILHPRIAWEAIKSSEELVYDQARDAQARERI